MKTHKTYFPLLFLLIPAMLEAQIRFDEISSSVGINFVPVINSAMAGGVAFFDYNNDGFDDIYITGGTRPDKLYLNNGDGTFTDRSIASGIQQASSQLYTLGVTTGDINNNGFRDIFVSTEKFSKNLLLRNNGNGTFTDISNSAGLGNIQRSNFTASFGDFNKDGYLDLYISSYLETAQGIHDSLGNMIGYAHKCAPNLLYINNQNNTFTESAALYNLDDTGCTLSVTFTDFDSDGDMDIISANDFGQWVVPNRLFQNNYPTTTFTDISNSSNLNTPMYSMGIAVGDYDQDLDLDYYVTNIARNTLYRNMGNGSFLDTTFAAGIEDIWVVEDSLRTSGWGAGFMDIDNDSYLDLFVVNGFINSIPLVQNAEENPDRLYRNMGNGTFINIADSLSINNTDKGRGFAFSDYDNDGDIDLMVIPVIRPVDTTNNAVNVLLYRNETNSNNNWLQVKLRGVQTNRDAYGCQIDIHVAGKKWRHEISGGASHLSQHSSVAHFGLGTATIVDSLVIRWLNSPAETYYNIPANQKITLVEGSSNPPTGLISNDLANSFRVFPNPTRGLFYVQYTLSTTQETSIEIYNQLGQKVFTQHFGWQTNGQQLHTIPYQNLTEGLYQVVLKTAKERLIQTIMIIN